MLRLNLKWVGAILAVLFAGAAPAQAIRLDGEQQMLLINPVGGLPGRWLSCMERCADPAAATTALLRVGEGGSRFGWRMPGDAEAGKQLEELVYVAE